MEDAHSKSDRTGHPRASITASNRLHMAKITELKHRDLAAGLVTLEGKKTVLISVYLDITQNSLKAKKGTSTRLTPYRPHNLPHMVLGTKQGPDNA